MLLITYLYFHYCNRFWWWILRPPGFFSVFSVFVFDFQFVTQKRVAAPTHRNFFLYFSHLLFDIPHLFVALALGYKRSKRSRQSATMSPVEGRQGGRERERETCARGDPQAEMALGIPSPESPKSKSNEIMSEIRDELGRCALFIQGIYTIRYDNIIFNNA